MEGAARAWGSCVRRLGAEAPWQAFLGASACAAEARGVAGLVCCQVPGRGEAWWRASLSCPRRIRPHRVLPGCLGFLLMRTERLSVLPLTAECLWAESCTFIFSCGLVSHWHLWKIGSRRHASGSWIDWNGCWERSPWLGRKEPSHRFVMSAVQWDGERGGGAPQPHQCGLTDGSLSVVLVHSLAESGLARRRGHPASSGLVVIGGDPA